MQVRGRSGGEDAGVVSECTAAIAAPALSRTGAAMGAEHSAAEQKEDMLCWCFGWLECWWRIFSGRRDGFWRKQILRAAAFMLPR